MTDQTRDRGVLSAADREYLRGEREMSHAQSRRNAEARIRRRIDAAVRDFHLIVNALPRKDRRQVFEAAREDEAFLDGLTAMLSFAYIGLREQGVDFERVLVPAITSAEEAYAVDRRSVNVSVDVAFDVETEVRSTHDEVVTRIQAGDPVTPRELFTLAMDGEYEISSHDRVRVALTGDAPGKPEPDFLERIADYLDADIRFPTDSRAVLEFDDEG